MLANTIETTFPVGYESFNQDAHLNFELNRWYSFGCASKGRSDRTGSKIRDFEEWVAVITRRGDEFLEQKDTFHEPSFTGRLSSSRFREIPGRKNCIPSS